MKYLTSMDLAMQSIWRSHTGRLNGQTEHWTGTVHMGADRQHLVTWTRGG